MGLVVPTAEQFGRRFNVVNTVPTLVLGAYVGMVLASGAPSQTPSVGRAAHAVAALGLADIALAGIAIVALGLLVHPLQFALVQALEGYWTFAGGLGDIAAARGRQRQLSERRRLNKLRLETAPTTWRERRNPAIIPLRQERANHRLTDFPHRKERTMATTLGNVLRRAEDFAGDRYGLDAIQWIPRLHPLAAPEMVAAITDARNQMDVALRFVLVWLVATVFGLVALAPHGGPWLLLTLATYFLAWLSYRGGVHAARGYGETLVWAIDLYRFQLVEQLRLPLPISLPRERVLNRQISTWLSGERLNLGDHADAVLGELPRYRHPSAPT